MARSNLTSNTRGFQKNPKSFVKDVEGTPIELEITEGGVTTTVIVNPRTLAVTGLNGEDVDASATRREDQSASN